MSAPELGNPFWRFSLAVYSQPGVAAECLALQEAAGIDVNLLLFCVWLGVERQVVLTDVELDEVLDRVRWWQERIVRPLRNVRRDLKTFVGDTPFRERVKTLELEGEQIEQAMLYDLMGPRWHRTCLYGPRQCVSENVSRFIARNGASASHWPARLVDAALRQHIEFRPDREKRE